MGVDYQAVLVVGLDRDEFAEQDTEDLYDKGLSFYSTYYDGSYGIVGIPVAKSGVYDYREVEDDLTLKIIDAKNKFFEITKKYGKLYISTYGW
jgi:hypothetical protein